MDEQDLLPIELELRKLEISENEAKIYLACLELEKSTVQEIAKKANLTRPTIYRFLEKMERRGLVKKIKQNGNPYILAQSPDELLNILHLQKRQIEEKEREFMRIISMLKNKFCLSKKNEIEIFPLTRGKQILLNDFSMTHSKEIFVYFSSNKIIDPEKMRLIYKKILLRLGEIKVQEIYFGKLPVFKNEPSYIKMKLTTKNFDHSFILCDKLIYFSKNEIISIRQPEIIKMFKTCLGE